MEEPGPAHPPRLTWPKILGLVALTVALSTVATVWAIRTFVFAPPFQPVELAAREQQVLDAKLERLERSTDAPAPPRLRPRSDGVSTSGDAPAGGAAIEPEAYAERDEDRVIELSEREINAVLARNTDLARRVAIDLSDDLISAKVLIPVDPDFPFLGGTTIRVRAGLTLAYERGRPVVVLRGVSLMGVPIPGAWLGGIKNIDLVERYGGDDGFWKAFADGVEHVRVDDGSLEIRLKE